MIMIFILIGVFVAGLVVGSEAIVRSIEAAGVSHSPMKTKYGKYQVIKWEEYRLGGE